MDWEKKFNSIIRDTDANLEKVKSRVLLSQRASAGGPVPAPSVGSTGAVVSPPAPGTMPRLADLQATLQKHSVELRRLAGVQRRHELENEYVRAELVRIRRDVKKLAGCGRPTADPSPTPTPTPTPAAVSARRSADSPAVSSDDVLRRIALLEERVASLQQQRNREKPSPRPLGLGSSPLACVDDHFPPETDDVTPTENGRLTEALGFNLDDLALSDSDDH